ncbi:MAG: energy coupling factor transporter S component ThiW [Clostridia bacterium]|nr:energy coupling factor transporter S component ThiW [Clostridia bacterium]
MKNSKSTKLAISGVLCALGVVGSLFSVPVFGSKCAPVQHMVNIICAVVLGPYYGVAVAFATSLIRNLLGLGSLMAFPGSMFGALLCGIMYSKTKNTWLTYLAEVFGTSILGGLCAYPVAVLLMGVSAGQVAFYAYIIPFFISTAAGALLSAIVVETLKKTKALNFIQLQGNENAN